MARRNRTHDGSRGAGRGLRRLALEQLEERQMLAVNLLDAAVDRLTLVVSNVTIRSDPSSSVTGWTDAVFAVPSGSQLRLAGYNAELGVSPAGVGITLTGAGTPNNPIFPGSVPTVYGRGDSLLLADNLPGIGQQNLIVDGAGMFRAQITVAPGVSGSFSLPFSWVYLFDSTPAEIPVDLVGGTLTVLAAPTVSIADVTVPEGNSGSTQAVFAVSLSAASDQTITVNYATADGTAKAGEDYQSTSGQLSFAPGELSKTITVNVIGDSGYEADEMFNVALSSASHAVINRGTALGTIQNDDASGVSLDADGNGKADALTDGILILRYLFDAGGQWNYSDALGSGATRTSRAAIKDYLDRGRSTVLDADGNGTPDALTDGILILRYLFDSGGQWNYSDALGAGATRTNRAQIKAYLDQYQPPVVPAPAGVPAAFSAESPPTAGTFLDNSAATTSFASPPNSANRDPSEPDGTAPSGDRSYPVDSGPASDDQLRAGVAAAVLAVATRADASRGSDGQDLFIGGPDAPASRLAEAESSLSGGTLACYADTSALGEVHALDAILQQWDRPVGSQSRVQRGITGSSRSGLEDDEEAVDRFAERGDMDGWHFPAS